MLSLLLSMLMLVDRALLPTPQLLTQDFGQPPPPQLPVVVRLIPPAPGQMYVEDLWRISLNNTMSEVFSVYLFVTIEKAGAGLLMDATTSVFLLPPGYLELSSSEMSPISTNFYDPVFETSVGQMGGFPDGTYIITFYVYEEGGGLVGTGDFTQNVENHAAPELQYPTDNSEVTEPLPIFIWFPSFPPGIVEYSIRIVNILEGQSPESAISANPAWLTANDIFTEELVYPVYASSFKYGDSYAWQVEGFYDGSSVGKSEIWTFSCVNPGIFGEEGSEIWSFETGDRVQCSPAIALDGSIICGSFDGFIYSLDQKGSELWRYPAGGPVYAVAIGQDGRIFATGDFGICCIDPSGFLVWNNNMTGPVRACPLILPSGKLYAGSIEGIFYSIDTFSGEIADTLKTDNSIVLPAASDSSGTIYFTCDANSIYAVDDDSSGFTTKWTFRAGDSFSGGPVIFGDNIYAAAGKEVLCFSMDGSQIWNSRLPSQIYPGPVVSSNGTVYAGTWSGNIYALEWDTGRRAGAIPAGTVVTSTPALNITGSLFFGCDDACLHCFSASGFLLWKFETKGAVRSSPVIGIDGTVYFGSDDNWIYAIAGSGSGPMTDGWPQYCKNSFNNGFVDIPGEEQ
ncbi:MAG: PQQ-binding-like beta-propeller repeat protein [Candidatus Aegiribacteria sp.]|nr:PQQ-binding-like beta-propeller repeat protein [Candidatus Aegiribacteria sp.]